MKKSLLALGIFLTLFFLSPQSKAQTLSNGVIYGSIFTCVGSASASPDVEHFLVTATGLTGALTASAPSGFEISVSATGGYSGTLNLAQAGTVSYQGTLYVRTAASAPAGNLSGNVTLATPGASHIVPVSATVNALPTVNTIADQTVANGDLTAVVAFGGTGNTFSWVNNTPSIGLAASGVGNIKPFAVKNPGTSAVTATVTATPINAGHAYVANLNSNTVSVVNLATNLTMATLVVGAQPDAVTVSPDGSKVFVVSDGAGTVSVINTSNNTVTGTIPAGSSPSGTAVTANGSMAYFTNSTVDSVTVVNTSTYKIVAHIHVGSHPEAICISPDGSRLYVADVNSNAVSVINTQTNLVVATIVVGSSPSGIAVSADGKKVYVANSGSGNVSVIATATNTVSSTANCGASPAGIALSPDGGTLYVCNTSAGMVTALNTQTFGIQTINVGSKPSGISITADGTRVYETNSGSNTLGVIDATSNTLLATIPTGSGPLSMGSFIKNGSGCAGTPITFKIIATPGISKNADLAGFSSASVKFTPVFNAATIKYTGNATFNTTSITITPTTYDVNATVKINGITVKSGVASQPIPLKIGYDTIKIVVTAQDKITQKTYTAVVSRFSSDAYLAKLKLSNGTLSPSFLPTTSAYTSLVVNAVEQITVVPTAVDATATITVNGKAVQSGAVSQTINLTAGNNISNLISVVVKAQDGVTTKTYNVFVTRALSPNAALSGLKLSNGVLSPVFNNTNSSYTTQVPNTLTSLTVTPTTADANAKVKINGVLVKSGSASAAIPLSIGYNIVTALVTAQDGSTTKTYTVVVYRLPSANANLSLLKISRGTLSPAFATTTTDYTASVVNGVSTVTVTPTTTSTTATVTINGTPVTSGSASAAIDLTVGANNIAVVVTAQDNTTIKTYKIVITRAASPENIPDEAAYVANPVKTPVIADDGIAVSQGLSPNGDGVNDRLTINGITQYPDNRLTIVNRNGSLIYETKGYDNETKAFDGRSNKTGQMQLPGTYYYSLDYTANGIIKHKTGYIILKY